MSKKTKNVQSNGGFSNYVTNESAVLHNAKFNTKSRKHFSFEKDTAINFFENAGPFELYDFTNVVNQYQNASLVYGRENESQARMFLKDILKQGSRKQFAKAPKLDEVEALRIRFPNFESAIERIAAATALSRISQQQDFFIKPLLLLGPPGIGKTAFCQAVAKLVKTPFKRIDIALMSTNALLSGLSLSWSTGHPGELLRYMAGSPVINPMVLFDEVDKAQGNHQHPIEPTLLSLLESESARTFQDEALQLNFNCEYLITLATANDAHLMSEPLLSRFDVVTVRQPNEFENKAIIKSIYQDFLEQHSWGSFFNTKPSDAVIEFLIGQSPRRIKAVLQTAFGNAARRHSNEIGLVDIEHLGVEGRRDRKYGFL